jgi:hypothetical protein
MGPFEAADVAFIETLKGRHETLKVQLAAVERAQDAQHAAKITAELQEIADQGSCRLLSNSRPTRGVHGSARTALVAAARRIGAAQLL